MKHKGGKGKKAPYETVVMRIPTPIEQDVRRLIEEFFSKGVTGLNKGVTGIEDKGVTGLNEGVTGIEDKGVTGIVDKDVTPIEELRLPITTYNTLKRAQINTIDELKAAKYNLNSIKKIGKESVKKIDLALLQYDSRYSD